MPEDRVGFRAVSHQTETTPVPPPHVERMVPSLGQATIGSPRRDFSASHPFTAPPNILTPAAHPFHSGAMGVSANADVNSEMMDRRMARRLKRLNRRGRDFQQPSPANPYGQQEMGVQFATKAPENYRQQAAAFFQEREATTRGLTGTLDDNQLGKRGKRNRNKRARNGDFGVTGKIGNRNPSIGSYDAMDRLTEADRLRLDASESPNAKVIVLNDIQKLSLAEINAMATKLGIEGTETRARHEVLFDIVRQCTKEPTNIIRTTGVLEVVKEGHGFLRNLLNSYTPSLEDVYVSPLQIKRLRLRTGDTIVGQIRQPRENEQFFALLKIETVDGDDPDSQRLITPFEQLTPFFPTQRFILERNSAELSTRIIDLVTPVGRGQRGLIVAGPRTGKTVIMQKIANSIIANAKDVEVIILLVDERPEEVTDMKREVNAEVVSSTFDEPPDRHVQVAEMVIEKAKRMVEHGRHVVILLDSITRLARAYNTIQPHSGRILSGGVDANALHKPKRFFGAARNIEGGGSLTILATALVDTGSKMDEVIFEEFKGTGNMELHLDRRLVDRRIYPAIDVEQSGTRREELLVDKDELERIWALRRAFTALQPAEAMEELIRRIKKTDNNIEFLLSLKLPPPTE